jgi:hypothetical protein
MPGGMLSHVPGAVSLHPQISDYSGLHHQVPTPPACSIKFPMSSTLNGPAEASTTKPTSIWISFNNESSTTCI